ncbi:Ldh family oxidoreductase [Neorhizobium sp. DT-125]|uniref:Ldh family oxidoreductase n=1 Tax=Neorhizobium sp. DT-125 TaxID=3396163 RepID=UPI003F1CBDC7
MASSFDYEALRRFAADLLAAAGLPERYGRTVAEVLLEGDLMGHDTHGLQLLPSYLASLKAGTMTAEGNQDVLRDTGAAAIWDGRSLPGPWLICEGMKLGIERAATHGTFTLSIRRSHHTAALTSYLKPVTDRGLVALLAVSDPTQAMVAPFGGTVPLYTTNPYAAGIPTDGDPILIDVSTSATTNGMVNRLRQAGEAFGYDALLDAEGNPTGDPAVRFADAPGSIMPLGGMQNGHKGFGLGLLVEALANALAGYGRADGPTGWQAGVFIQVLDPEFFGGRAAFLRETGWLAGEVRNNPPRDPSRPVRLPGQRGLALRRQMLAHGVRLGDGIVAGLEKAAAEFGVPMIGGSAEMK